MKYDLVQTLSTLHTSVRNIAFGYISVLLIELRNPHSWDW